MNRFKTKEFLKIQKEWYAVLRKHGFIDQEGTKGGEPFLKQKPRSMYQTASEVVRSTRLDYYLLISRRIQIEEFKKELHRLIMTMVSDGTKIKDICEKLKEYGYDKHRQTVRFIIRRYENKWGIREWKPHQMTSKR